MLLRSIFVHSQPTAPENVLSKYRMKIDFLINNQEKKSPGCFVKNNLNKHISAMHAHISICIF